MSPAHRYFPPSLQKRTASAMHILSHNVTSNAKRFTQPPGPSPQPLALDWDVENLPEQVTETGSFDVILYVSSHAGGICNPVFFSYHLNPFFLRMADVTYNTASFPSLLRTLSSLVQLNLSHSRSPPIVILGYKERDPDERSLWGMLETQVGIRLEKVGECEGWPESIPIEIWIGSLEREKNPSKKPQVREAYTLQYSKYT